MAKECRRVFLCVCATPACTSSTKRFCVQRHYARFHCMKSYCIPVVDCASLLLRMLSRFRECKRQHFRTVKKKKVRLLYPTAHLFCIFLSFIVHLMRPTFIGGVEREQRVIFVQQAAITALAPPARQRRRQRPTLQPRPETSENNWLRMIREKAAALDDASTFEAKDFRRNFRLPFPVFKQLLAAAREQTWLKCNDHDAAGRSCVPLELKLLGLLYLLGSGAPVRTVAQLMSMSEATLQRSLHAFCSDFAADRYDEWIRPSDDLEALQIVMQDYAVLEGHTRRTAASRTAPTSLASPLVHACERL
jgi:hypothetical protein